MSYDVYLRGERCATCGVHSEPHLPDPTYNLTPIFDLALTDEPMPAVGEKPGRETGLRLLSGKKGAETVDRLRLALVRLSDPARAESFRALEPPNKWGTLEGAITVMTALRDAATEYPTHTWEIT